MQKKHATHATSKEKVGYLVDEWLRFSLVAKQMMKTAKPPSEAGRFPASWMAGWLSVTFETVGDLQLKLGHDLNHLVLLLKAS